MPSPEQSTSVRAAYLEYSPPLSPCSTSVLTAVDLEDYTPSADLIPRPSRQRIIIIAVSIFALACVTYVIVKTDILSVGSLTPDDYNANIPRDESNNADAAYQMRLHSFCGVTDFKDLCVYDISNSSSTEPSGGSAATSHRRAEVSTKGMVVASIQVAVDGMHRTLNYYRSGKLDSSLKQGIEECNELLGLSLVELDDARSNVLAADVNDLLPMMAADLRDALSAAVTYEQTCAASISSAAMASQAASTAEILSLLGNATISTRNTLAIISSVTEPAEGFYTLPLQPEVDAPSMKPPAEGNLLMEEMGTVEATRGDASIWFPPDINKAPDAVVSKDGSGDCKTVADSLKLAVAGGRERSGRFLIYVKKGVYEETVHVTAEMTRITMYGDGPENTILTGRKRAAGGSTLYGSATFAVTGNAFVARGMRFENRGGGASTAAVALRVESDLSVFHNCHVESNHTPLYAHAHRQFYRDCVVAGSTDLITGDASAALQNCRIKVKASPAGISSVVTASTRLDRHQSTAISLQNCTVSTAAGKVVGPALLGRLGGWSARAVVMNSELERVVAPAGWEVAEGGGGDGGGAGTEVFFGEYENRGAGSRLEERVRWAGYHEMSTWDARKFAAGELVQGVWWLNATGVPFDSSLF